MGFVDRELEKLSRALCENGDRYAELYAAQQALGWATDPKAFRSPYNMIMGIPAETADCSVDIHHSPLPDTGAAMSGAV